MKNTALITGASNGIGLELARIHAKKGGDLVLVARSKDKLLKIKEELEQKHGVSVEILSIDLTKEHAAKEVFDFTKSKAIQIDVLINNAGFGGHGKFYERELKQDKNMMQLNMVTLTELTHYFLQDMVSQNQGKILNVSSTVSFMPGPLQAVYYATKAFVTSFSQAIAEEVRDKNITVTALCPGAVDTDFAKAGNLEGVELWNNAKSARSVAECGYQAMEKGDLIAFNEFSLKFMINWIIPFLPRKILLKLSCKLMEKKSV